MSAPPLIGRARLRQPLRVPCGCCPVWFAPTRHQRRALRDGQQVYCSPACRAEGRRRWQWRHRQTQARQRATRPVRQLPLFGEEG